MFWDAFLCISGLLVYILPNLPFQPITVTTVTTTATTANTARMHDLKTLAENDLNYLGVSMDNVTLCECKDGIYLHGGFVLPDPPVIPADFLDKCFRIRFRNMTKKMLLLFLATPAGEEIIECLRDQGVDHDKVTAWSFTQLLAMKAAKEVYDYRLLGGRGEKLKREIYVPSRRSSHVSQERGTSLEMNRGVTER